MDSTDELVERLLARLDLEAKTSLLSGRDYWSLPAIPAIGLDALVMSDGPVGVRGTGWAPDQPSVALPAPAALAATWDPALAERAGRVLGEAARRRGVHVLLAPTVNLHRTPYGGRHFECYSEDPLLTAEIGAGFVAGVQAAGVAATVKHLVANDSETERMGVDVRVSERALRELYLVPFETIVRRARVWAVMAAYNRVNGDHMTANRRLLRDLLKGEWAFDGVVVSDWTAAHETAGTALGGLDVVMPAAGSPWGPALVDAVRSGAVAETVVDDQVRRVLRLAARVGALRGAPAAPRNGVGEDPAQVAREIAARSTVLARNADQLLPLDAGRLRRVAVLGAFARDTRIQGGGSATVQAAYRVSALDGLTAALPPEVEVAFVVGGDPQLHLPAAAGPGWTTAGGAEGFEARLRDRAGQVRHQATLRDAAIRWFGGYPGFPDGEELGSIELSARYTPRTSGVHQFSAGGHGVFRLQVADQTVYSGPVYPADASGDVLVAATERRTAVHLTAGVPVRVGLVQQVEDREHAAFVEMTLGHAEPAPEPDEMLDEAVRVAADADVAVVVVGTTEEVESEGFDRTSLALPGRQDELVARVAAANPRTVVVVYAGAPVLMPWADDVAAILLAWFGGQEAGAALADVLLGAAEPGGRLPTTWPRRAADCPVRTVAPTGGVLAYDEGIFVGYRAWERAATAPLFPFGHGLGYTSWSYERLAVRPGEGLGTAVVTLRNTGDRPGREVVQLYVGPEADDPDRPRRWLAGSAVVEAAPGETVTVRVPLPERTIQTWDGGWHTVPGAYRVEAARSIADRLLSAVVTAEGGG